MEFAWSTEEQAYRTKIAEMLDDIMRAAGEEGDVRGFGAATFHSKLSAEEQLARSKLVCGKLAEYGYLTPNWPKEYGGLDLSPWEAVILAEEVLFRGEPRGSQYMNANWIGPSIIIAGTPEQKTYFLGRISRGDITWCQGFSEPDAGSDLAALQTSAVRDGDEYVVNGEKIWTSHTPTAEYCYLLVRTDREAEKHLGISILLVPMDTAGLEVHKIPAVGGVGDSSFANLRFTDMRVPASARLGPENQGWPIVRKALAFERTGMPRYLNAAIRLDKLVAWATEHDVHDVPRNQELLGLAKSWCDAARLLHYRVIHERSKEFENPGPEAYVSRAAMVKAERMVDEAATQIMLDAGLVDDAIAAQYMGGITAGIAGGAYEIQLNLIGRQLFSGEDL